MNRTNKAKRIGKVSYVIHENGGSKVPFQTFCVLRATCYKDGVEDFSLAAARKRLRAYKAERPSTKYRLVRIVSEVIG